jgi:hypothetical protein
MSLYIKHRVNILSELKKVENSWGVEIDLRSDVRRPGHLHLSHDPWFQGPDFEVWLKQFKKQQIRGPIILNTKEDGLERSVLALMRKYQIEKYFFLDTAFPTLIRWSLLNRNKNFALRMSKYESRLSLNPFIGKVSWVWVDCFGGKPVSKNEINKLSSKFKVCLVSPELQGQPVFAIKKFMSLKGLCDAICTKRPDLWEKP